VPCWLGDNRLGGIFALRGGGAFVEAFFGHGSISRANTFFFMIVVSPEYTFEFFCHCFSFHMASNVVMSGSLFPVL